GPSLEYTGERPANSRQNRPFGPDKTGADASRAGGEACAAEGKPPASSTSSRPNFVAREGDAWNATISGLPTPSPRLPDMVELDPEIEIIRPDFPRGRFRSVLFDFDGTLSLIREGWPQVMIPMMVQELQSTGTAETQTELTAAVEEFVMQLNGRQTIYQMIRLTEEVTRRGGAPLEAVAYK